MSISSNKKREHIIAGMKEYLRDLHKWRAVDEVKMKFVGYLPLEECLKLWGIEFEESHGE